MGLCKFTRFFANVQLYICALAKRHADANAECGIIPRRLGTLRTLGTLGTLETFKDFKELKDFRDFRGLRRCTPQHLAESLFVIGELLLQTLACRVYARLDCA